MACLLLLRLLLWPRLKQETLLFEKYIQRAWFIQERGDNLSWRLVLFEDMSDCFSASLFRRMLHQFVQFYSLTNCNSSPMIRNRDSASAYLYEKLFRADLHWANGGSKQKLCVTDSNDRHQPFKAMLEKVRILSLYYRVTILSVI